MVHRTVIDRNRMKNRRNKLTLIRGFTLIELMIAIAIVGILAAIAYPSYADHVRKGRRASAQAHLMDVAQREQQYLLDQRSYAATVAALGMSTPSDVSTFYTITITAPAGTPPTFTATATPIAGSAQATDGAISINQANVKTPANYW